MNLLYLIIPFFILIFILYIASAKCRRKEIAIINGRNRIRVDAEIADGFATMFKGLMGRRSLGEKEGMLFVFGKPDRPSFWMLNTYIPLDAIFFDQGGIVVDIIQMEPCGLNLARCRLHRPRKPSMYVLEARMGFAETNSIEIGKSRIVL